ncbi:hypothetical protein Emag_003462 [Eimeria magna]
METEEAYAAESEQYAEAQGLRELMQSLMRLLLQQQPDDPVQCLIDHLKGQLKLQEEAEAQQQEQQQGQQQQQVGPPLKLILISLPGSGRRKLSQRLAELWKLPLISAADLLRLHAEQEPKGEASRALATKTLADDELVIQLVGRQLQQQQQLLLQGQSSGWILDGFPRTRRQAVALLQLRLSPDRCCLLLPPDEGAKAALRAAAMSAAVKAAASAAAAAASQTKEGPRFCTSTTPASERQARLQLSREADKRLRLAYSGVLDVLGPLVEIVPAGGGMGALVDTLQVIGCRGSGKSTQSRLLVNRYGVVHVDIRELLLQRLVADRLAAADCARRGWVLEGFPITAQQANLLREYKLIPDVIVCLEVPEGTLVDRVSGCRVDSNTGKVSYDPPVGCSTKTWASPKDAARLVEMRDALLRGSNAVLCCSADDSISRESVGERILEFLRRLELPDDTSSHCTNSTDCSGGPRLGKGPCFQTSPGLRLEDWRMRFLPAASLLFVVVSSVALTSSFRLNVQRSAFRGPCGICSSSSRRSSKFSACKAAAAAGAAAGQVDVEQVKQLRQLTSAGYGRCVKALQQSGGDLSKAANWLRQQGAADAAAAAAATAAAAAAAAAASSGSACEAVLQQQGVVALFRIDSAPAARTAGAAGATAIGAERVAAVQLSCCTDFVARSSVFTAAARRAAAAACQSETFAAAARAAAADAAAGKLRDESARAQQQQQLLQHLLSLPSGEAAAAAPATVAEDLGFLSRLVGEQTTLRRVAVREAHRSEGIVASYSHQSIAPDVAPLVVLLHLSYTRQQKQQQPRQEQEQQQQQQQQQEKEEEEDELESQLRLFGKQLCMHIAATKPLAVRVEDLPPSLVAQERQFAVDSLNKSSSSSSSSKGSSSKSSSSKSMPEALKQKILEGKLSKWYREVVLLKQPWALDDSGKLTETIVRDTERRLGWLLAHLQQRLVQQQTRAAEVAAGAAAVPAALALPDSIEARARALVSPPVSFCLPYSLESALLLQRQLQKQQLLLVVSRRPMETAAKGPPNEAEAPMSRMGAPVKAVLADESPKRSSLVSALKETDALSPRGEIQRLLREAHAADLEAYGADVRDPAATWAAAASSSRRRRHTERRRPPARPLPDYSIAGFTFGPQTRCWGLEPFDALSPHEYLGGPGGPCLSSADRKLLEQVGVDFLETGDTDTRKAWMPHERERWRRSKRLRYLLKNGLVVFRDDYMRAEFEKDFLRFLGRPPKARENPWGPLEVEDQVAGLRGTSAGTSKGGGDRGDYAASLPWSYFFEVKHETRQPRENTPRVEAVSARSEERQAEDDLKLRRLRRSRRGLLVVACVIRGVGLPLHACGKVYRHQTLRGSCCHELDWSSLAARISGRRREKHPKDVTVPFHRLKAYGEMIVQEVNNEMRAGWGQCARSSLLAESTPTPKGVRDNPNYKLTPEKLRKAAAKLKVEIAQDTQDILAAAERRRRAVEPSRLLGGGRYAV